jgi:hypothetical protein
VPRGYNAKEYAEFIAELADRRWAEPSGPATYRLTKAGCAARIASEQATNALFYAP